MLDAEEAEDKKIYLNNLKQSLKQQVELGKWNYLNGLKEAVELNKQILKDLSEGKWT